MADLAVVPSQVQLGAGQHKIRKSLIAGDDVDAGETGFFDLETNVLRLTDVFVSATTAQTLGLCLNSARRDQPVDVLLEGEVILGAGAAPAVATPYFASDNNGKIAPDADITTGNFKTFLGIGKAGNRLQFKPVASGAQVP